ncbi:hypothetical protein [Nocardiopsis suaedae]|uniref:Transmembrane protein n=1 Tax=Nocardiopsis suaedae TaxID=3018444 RepID=A0ABT4TNU3_9ACTN|nr:hypothetical protein [Nocardiopsis suaedae]MDA2805924.1 hypothetical protein [Nocardiopsis suaedae]
MKLYADRPARFALQVLADALAVLWIALWIKAALALHDTVAAAGASGTMLADAGDAVDRHMGDAADAARQVPLAGDSLASPLTSVGEAGASLGDAGRSLQESIASSAVILGLLTAFLPIVVLLGTWLPARLRWIRQASTARSAGALKGRAGERVLALRALASARPARLAAVRDDPVEAWRDDDEEAVRALAALELRRLGLRPRMS